MPCFCICQARKKKDNDEDSLNHADMTCHPYCNVVLSFNGTFLCVYVYTCPSTAFSARRNVFFNENNASIHLDLSERVLLRESSLMFVKCS